MRSLIGRIIPFIILGITIVAFIGGLILFSYLLIAGAVVGLVLFLLTWLREQLFSSNNKKMMTKEKPRQGRTFDHKD